MSKYVLDADVFIAPARTYYPFDLAPGFWKLLTRLGEEKKIVSVDRVRNELLQGNDELAEWANKRKFPFESTDGEDIHASYSSLLDWAKSQNQYSPEAIQGFEDVADAWLIAYAKTNGHSIVTHEKPDVHIKVRVPIPNVCEAFGIECVTLFDMLRRLNVQLMP